MTPGDVIACMDGYRMRRFEEWLKVATIASYACEASKNGKKPKVTSIIPKAFQLKSKSKNDNAEQVMADREALLAMGN